MFKTIKKSNIATQEGRLGQVDNWRDLGILLRVKTHIMSWALLKKKDLQKRIHIQGRTVYSSAPALKFVQERLALLLTNLLMEKIPTKHMLAYIPGKDPRQILRDTAVGHKYQVMFDIQKYYDNITTGHIVEALQVFGFTKRGAMLAARYCTVERTLKGGKRISTLQQGSPASPVISNLVGYLNIDMPIMDWLKEMKEVYPGVETLYYRYSDNVVLFLDGDIPGDFLKEYKKFVWDTLPTFKLYTHKWAMVPNTHPRMHQKFLGVVINQIARLERPVYDALRALLLNSSRLGLKSTLATFYETETLPDESHEPLELSHWNNLGKLVQYKKFNMVVTGKIAYLKSINPKHYLALTKLQIAYRIIGYLDMNLDTCPVELPYEVQHQMVKKLHRMGPAMLHPDVLESIKRYRNPAETREEYAANLVQVCLTLYKSDMHAIG